MNLSKMRNGVVGIITAGAMIWAASGSADEIEPRTAAVPENLVECVINPTSGGGGRDVRAADPSKYEIRAGNVAVGANRSTACTTDPTSTRPER